MPFPSTISTFAIVSPTDKLNSPSHSSLHNSLASVLTQVQTVIGVEGPASVVGSLEYLIKSPDSDGGGHVQSANKGGTGQTNYAKGDILVGTSSSVLSKFSKGLDGRAIVYNSSTASGLDSQGIATEKQLQDQTYTYAQASVLSASVYGITFPNAVSVLSAGQAFAIKWPTTNTTSVLALQISSLLAQRIKNTDLTNPIVGAIRSSMISIVENDGVNFQLSAPYVPTYPANTTTFLRGDGTFASNSTSYSNVTATRAGNTASGDQVIAHGLGKVPAFTKITVRAANSGSNGSIVMSDGSYNGTTTTCVWIYSGTPSAAGSAGADTTNVIVMTFAATSQVATIARDATNITLTWTRSGSTPADVMNIMVENMG